MTTKHTKVNKQYVRIDDLVQLMQLIKDYDVPKSVSDAMLRLITLDGYATAKKIRNCQTLLQQWRSVYETQERARFNNELVSPVYSS